VYKDIFEDAKTFQLNLKKFRTPKISIEMLYKIDDFFRLYFAIFIKCCIHRTSKNDVIPQIFPLC